MMHGQKWSQILCLPSHNVGSVANTVTGHSSFTFLDLRCLQKKQRQDTQEKHASTELPSTEQTSKIGLIIHLNDRSAKHFKHVTERDCDFQRGLVVKGALSRGDGQNLPLELVTVTRGNVYMPGVTTGNRK
jgi:hypothetical protein